MEKNYVDNSTLEMLKSYFMFPMSNPTSTLGRYGGYEPKKKMVMISLKNRNFIQPMGRPNTHSGWALFFPFGGGGGGGGGGFFLFFFMVGNWLF
jgi:hypothetical protein